MQRRRHHPLGWAWWSVGRQRGQTLVEVLVVVTLIVLLVIVLVPALKRSLQAAKSAACKSNLHQIALGLQMYRSENSGWLPAVQSSTLSPDPSPEDTVWFRKLTPTYLPDLHVLVCREDPFGSRMLGSHDGTGARADYASYGISSFIMTGGGGFLANLDRHRPSRPGDTLLVADAGPDYGLQVQGDDQADGPPRNASLLVLDDEFDPFTGDVAVPWVTTRHGRGINMMTIEGGVRDARTLETVRNPISRFYENCAAGGCTLCRELRMFHYSFARDRLYWWTGPVPSE